MASRDEEAVAVGRRTVHPRRGRIGIYDDAPVAVSLMADELCPRSNFGTISASLIMLTIRVSPLHCLRFDPQLRQTVVVIQWLYVTDRVALYIDDLDPGRAAKDG